jgi:hypothetical protein
VRFGDLALFSTSCGFGNGCGFGPAGGFDAFSGRSARCVFSLAKSTAHGGVSVV